MTTRTRLLNVAMAEVGYRSGPGNTNKYYAELYPAWNGYAWCGTFTGWCQTHAGLKAIMPVGVTPIFSVPAIKAAAIRLGVYRSRAYAGHLQASDLDVWNWGGVGDVDHVSISRGAPSGSKVPEVGGNTRGGTSGPIGVYAATRLLGDLDGFVDMSKWLEGTPTPMTPTVKGWVAGERVVTAMQVAAKSPGRHDGWFDSQDSTYLRNFPRDRWTTIHWTTRKNARGSVGMKAWQRLVGAKQDGIGGPDTAAHTQRWAGLRGNSVDSILGTESIEAICHKLGVK